MTEERNTNQEPEVEIDDFQFLTNLITTAVTDNEEIQNVCHRIAINNLPSIKVPADFVFVGGDERDLKENALHGILTIIESDPRHDQYWSLYALTMATAVNRAVGSWFVLPK